MYYLSYCLSTCLTSVENGKPAWRSSQAGTSGLNPFCNKHSRQLCPCGDYTDMETKTYKIVDANGKTRGTVNLLPREAINFQGRLYSFSQLNTPICPELRLRPNPYKDSDKHRLFAKVLDGLMRKRDKLQAWVKKAQTNPRMQSKFWPKHRQLLQLEFAIFDMQAG